MKLFWIRLLIFSLCFFAFDKLFIFQRNRIASLEVDTRLENIITGHMNKDVLIFGSSRGARNIIASQISGELGVKAYNLSYPGSDIQFQDFLLKEVIKNNKPPKLIILTVDDSQELAANKLLKFRFDRLYPLVKYPAIREELVARGEKSAFFSKMFILYQLGKNCFSFSQKRFSKLDSIGNCGSMPLSFQKANYEFSYSNDALKYSGTIESRDKINSFLDFVNICHNKHIKLVIVFPPNFRRPNRDFEKRIISLAGEKTFFIHYDTTESVYYDKKFYYDGSHLVTSGAKIFTEEIIDNLSKNGFERTKATALE